MNKSFSILIISVLSFAVASSVSAASLYLSPPSGTYFVDEVFQVSVKVDSGGAAVNAAESALVFNPDELQIQSISKADSIFNLWTQEPVFSNSVGNIVFGGGSPGNFTGASGTVLTVNFKGKSVCSSQISFSSGSVLAADGKGTNVLSVMNGAVYILKPKAVTPPAPSVPPSQMPSQVEEPPALPYGVPSAPVVNSSTHPDANQWYSNSSPEFSWQTPPGITAVKLSIGKLPTGLPIVNYVPPISEKKLEDLDDGVWYFSARFRNNQGWGVITHRKVLIDTTPPEPFTVEIDNGGDSTNPTPVLHFETVDQGSGVEYYEVDIGEEYKDKIAHSDVIKHNPYKTPPLLPKPYTIVVKAFDKAGNSTVAATAVKIEPVEPPTITLLSQVIKTDEPLNIQGVFSPLGTVNIYVKKEGEEPHSFNVKVDEQGNWSFTYEKSLEKGVYQVWAEGIDERGARSALTEKNTISVSLPPLLRFGRITMDYLTVLITFIVLLAGVATIIFYIWHRISIWRKRVRKETGEAAEGISQAFEALRKEIEKQVAMLDKKPALNKKEKELKDNLESALNAAEKIISKEIKDVEKQLE